MMMNIVEATLLENANNPNSLFIFPTDVAASRWADHLLRLLFRQRGQGTLAMDKFIAWDTFKQNSIRSKVQNKKSIPSALRKIFASSLIMENAQACLQAAKTDGSLDAREPVFSSLILPKWAGQAAQFTDWLTELLPQLGTWLKKTTSLEPALLLRKDATDLAGGLDAGDRDLYTLAIRYAQFLETHGLFEPAWETPPFENEGKECFIFFPNTLSDYARYESLLSASGHVKTIIADSQNTPCDIFFYANSRSEIAEAALYIRNLHEQRNIPWDSIVVSIPNEENYEPYVLREFANRNIPFVKRIGKPLTGYPAGKFFGAVAACASRDFAFSAVTALILNNNLPWKDTQEIKKLVDFGIKNNCICSWTETENGKELAKNPWEDAFSMPFGGFDTPVRQFFWDLKKRVMALRSVSSFAQLRKQYFSFRERFFNMDNCTPETDLVLSRCICELMYLCEIEKDFPDVKAPDTFMFFTEYLGEINYLAQQPAAGVTILPYRTAACAPFDCHVILDASQESLSAVFSELKFLPKAKREKLGLADEDASAAFIEMHKFNSVQNAAFFCSEQTFSGYAIPHSKLDAPQKPKTRYAQEVGFSGKFSEDLFNSENALFASLTGGGLNPSQTIKLHWNQKKGFEEWYSRRKNTGNPPGEWRAGKNLLEFIREQYSGHPEFPGKYSVSASSLEVYNQCSLKWLFERVLAVKNVHIEASLLTENIIGMVYHSALNLFLTELKKNQALLACPQSPDGNASPGLPPAYGQLLEHCMETLFAGFPCLPSNDKPCMSALTARLLKAEKIHFQLQIEKCLTAFLSCFAGYRIIGSENSYRLERDDYFINGKLDCILQAAGPCENPETKDKLAIVDFKLKYLPSPEECTGGEKNGLENFQLPMYLSLAEEAEKNEVHTALFFSILDLKPQVVFGTVQDAKSKTLIPKNEAEQILRNSGRFQNIMAEFRQKTMLFADEIKSGNFSVFETEFDNCNKCSFRRICRSVYKIDRQKIPLFGAQK